MSIVLKTIEKATAGKLKAEGVRPGVPDLCLPVPRGPYHGLYLELKRRRGGKLSLIQQTWLDRLTAQGYRTVVAKGASEAIRELERYLQGAEPS
ncbi:MAG: VRR-NUC domain-containing protein [Truepera sp.]|nr:VRR-NUC domain-containing protein [Truepera sp.]